jgi:GNAT superfamily N-acetyltransferase
MSTRDGTLSEPTVTLRAHRPGDIGWVVARHGVFYSSEFGWNNQFEGMVAQIAGRFLERFDAAREACWIAERDGVAIGSVFLVQARDETYDRPLEGVAQLRMLFVEPAARGLGVGRRLVEQCEAFARDVGYRSIRLWTNSILNDARQLYRRTGYRLVRSDQHRNFGHDLVSEIWELDLLAKSA